jgi:hypothetical protein
VNDTRRQNGIAVLLAISAVLATFGANAEKKTPWFISAGILLSLAVLWSAAPPSNRVGILTIISRWIYRKMLSPKPGWRASNAAIFGGTSLLLNNDVKQALPGFMCEIQGPAGDYVAYTEDALKVAKSTRSIDRLSLPMSQPSAMLIFPDEFTTVAGEKEINVHGLPRGRYHVLWWCWQRATDGLSLELDFVAGQRFNQGRAGLGRFRWLRARSRDER